MNTQHIVIVIALILAIGAGVALGNPQILSYSNGYWFNDHQEQVNPAIVQDYYTISNSPWVINVVAPGLHYSTDRTYSNGEVITIEVTGMGTMTLTAHTPISISVD